MDELPTAYPITQYVHEASARWHSQLLGKEPIMTITRDEAQNLYNYIHPLVQDSDSEAWQSLSDATGYASTTRSHTFEQWYDRFADDSDLMDSFDRWARDHGYTPFVVPTTLQELQVGDVVRLVGGRWTGHRLDGTTNVVDRTTDDYQGSVHLETGNVLNLDYPFEFVSRPGVYTATSAQQKSLEEALAAGEYHPDMLPLFEKFSKVADDAGHCAEYDRLARAAGAPTRAEVRTLVLARDGAKYRVTVPVTVNLTVEVNATSAEDARQQALSTPLVDSLEGNDATANSWLGLAAAVTAAAQDTAQRGYPRRDTMTFEGVSSFRVDAL